LQRYNPLQRKENAEAGDRRFDGGGKARPVDVADHAEGEQPAAISNGARHDVQANRGPAGDACMANRGRALALPQTVPPPGACRPKPPPRGRPRFCPRAQSGVRRSRRCAPISVGQGRSPPRRTALFSEGSSSVRPIFTQSPTAFRLDPRRHAQRKPRGYPARSSGAACNAIHGPASVLRANRGRGHQAFIRFRTMLARDPGRKRTCLRFSTLSRLTSVPTSRPGGPVPDQTRAGHGCWPKRHALLAASATESAATASLPPQWPRHRHICDGSEGLRHCVARMGACGCCCPSCAVRAPGDPAHAQERVLCSASTPPASPSAMTLDP
jgi:hypothetical protein